MTRGARTAAGVLAAGLFVYPILFYLSYDVMGLLGLSMLFAALASLRILTLRRLPSLPRWLAGAAVVCFVLAVSYWHSSRLLKLYPVAVNAAFLVYGLYTLRHPPSAIERLVRALGRPVSEAGVAYTRNVTRLWCGFFAVNGAAAACTALAAPTSVWAWYNGAVSYGIAAALFVVELVFRGFYRRRVARLDGDGVPRQVS